MNNEQKIKIVKITRIIFIIPILIMICIALVGSFDGISSFMNSKYWGITAFAWVLIAFIASYWWIWLICIIGILATSILLKTINKQSKKSSIPEANVIVIGKPGSGKCHHPWDNLKPCSCGCRERPLLMYEKDELYFCGGTTENIFALCSKCGRHTEKSDILTTINNWNNEQTVDASGIEER